MNTKDYIESGILDAYALGALPPEEAAAVEQAVSRYPELAAELAAIQATVSQMAGSAAVPPPPHMQQQIWNAIQAADAPHVTTRQIPLPPPATREGLTWGRAAVWAALIGSTVLNVLLINNSNRMKGEQTAMRTEVGELKQAQQQLAAEMDDYRKAQKMMADTATQTVVMHTVVQGHPMAATVYWSKQNGAAWVAMNALPVPPKGKQYQLWVIQNGKPVSMGVLPGYMASTPGVKLVDMQVMNAEAFAISLEKEGGNATPTEVYVLGKA